MLNLVEAKCFLKFILFKDNLLLYLYMICTKLISKLLKNSNYKYYPKECKDTLDNTNLVQEIELHNKVDIVNPKRANILQAAT